MSRDFLTVATELSMLTADLADTLTREATQSGETVESIVAQRGLMSAVQLDIVQTLRRPHDVIPGYELLSIIGQGGMGVVYRARQKTLDRVVAIKTILVSQMNDRSMAARFEQEARAVAKLQHPNIIAAIDFGQHDGRLFFAMELVEGEDLDSRINRNRQPEWGGGIDEGFAWGLARQAASGLAHAAEQGIVHRDIKPANLLLVEPPAGFPLPAGMPLVKIADFGLAFLATEADARTRLTAANMAVGSPHYMAPEQLSGDTVDERADIYGLGATLFHLLSGKPPYAGMPLTQILTKKLTSDSPRLKSVRPDISQDADDLVAAMMSRQPTARIGSYAELLRRFDSQSQFAAKQTQLAVPIGNQTGSLPSRPIPNTELSTRPTATSQLAVTAAMPVPAEAVLPTVELTPTEPISKFPLKRRRQLLGVLIGVALYTVAKAGFRRFKNSQRPQILETNPQLVSSGWSQPLFAGNLIDQWKTRSGTWGPVYDEEGAFVLSGANGVIVRKLNREDGKPVQPLKHFTLSLAVRIREANAIEVHFGILSVVGDNGPRLALRVEPETAWLAFRSSDRGSSEPRSSPVPLDSASRDKTRTLRVTRDETHWFAFVNEQLVGSLPLSQLAEESEIRLLTEAGPAWFFDVEVEELRAGGK